MVARQRRRRGALIVAPSRYRFHWRHRWARLRRRRGSAAAVLAGTMLLLATLALPPRPRLLWNASLSSPAGLYAVGGRRNIGVGQMVIAWPPGAIRRLAAERHYLPLNVPLVKRVAAARGDLVCASGPSVFVNGRLIARRFRADRNGRPLPWWQGCRRLGPGQLFLLSANVPQAFDGRYFGVTGARDVIGAARHIWPFD